MRRLFWKDHRDVEVVDENLLEEELEILVI